VTDPDLVSFAPVTDEDANETARRRAKQLGPGKNIVTVIIDTGFPLVDLVCVCYPECARSEHTEYCVFNRQTEHSWDWSLIKVFGWRSCRRCLLNKYL